MAWKNVYEELVKRKNEIFKKELAVKRVEQLKAKEVKPINLQMKEEKAPKPIDGPAAEMRRIQLEMDEWAAKWRNQQNVADVNVRWHGHNMRHYGVPLVQGNYQLRHPDYVMMQGEQDQINRNYILRMFNFNTGTTTWTSRATYYDDPNEVLDIKDYM